jgi:hypothetical protein
MVRHIDTGEQASVSPARLWCAQYLNTYAVYLLVFSICYMLAAFLP